MVIVLFHYCTYTCIWGGCGNTLSPRQISQTGLTGFLQQKTMLPIVQSWVMTRFWTKHILYSPFPRPQPKTFESFPRVGNGWIWLVETGLPLPFVRWTKLRQIGKNKAIQRLIRIYFLVQRGMENEVKPRRFIAFSNNDFLNPLFKWAHNCHFLYNLCTHSLISLHGSRFCMERHWYYDKILSILWQPIKYYPTHSNIIWSHTIW